MNASTSYVLSAYLAKLQMSSVHRLKTSTLKTSTANHISNTAYTDPEFYRLEINLPAGSKPYFQGSAVSSAADVTWRLSYHKSAGVSGTIYSTILSGTSAGNNLYIVPVEGQKGVEFPVNGVNGVRDGYLTTIDSLVIA